MDMRGQAPLRFDGGEVLDVVAEEAAQVLDEPVERVSKRGFVLLSSQQPRVRAPSHRQPSGLTA
jgi:hypothetical protein